jgi:hypothetical protein
MVEGLGLFFQPQISQIFAGFAILCCYQRAYTKLPNFTLVTAKLKAKPDWLCFKYFLLNPLISDFGLPAGGRQTCPELVEGLALFFH